MEWITSGVKAVANRFFYGGGAAPVEEAGDKSSSSPKQQDEEMDHHEEEEVADVNDGAAAEADDDNVAFTSSLLCHPHAPAAPACNVAVAVGGASPDDEGNDKKRAAETTMEIEFEDDDDSEDDAADDGEEAEQQATNNNKKASSTTKISTQTSCASAATMLHSNLTSTSQQKPQPWTKYEQETFFKAIETYGYDFELVSEEMGTRSKQEVYDRAVRCFNYQPGDVHQNQKIKTAVAAKTTTTTTTSPPPPPPATTTTTRASAKKASTPAKRRGTSDMQLGLRVSPRGRRRSAAAKKKRQAASSPPPSTTPATKKRRGRPPGSSSSTNKATKATPASASGLKSPPPPSSSASKRIGRPSGSKNKKPLSAEAKAATPTSKSIGRPTGSKNKKALAAGAKASASASASRMPRNALDLIGRRFAKAYARTTYFGTIVSYDPNTAKFTLHFDEDADVLILPKSSLKKLFDKYEERKDWDVKVKAPVTIEQLLDDPELPIREELGIAKFVMLLKGKDGEDARAWQGKNQPGYHALVSGDVEEYCPPTNSDNEEEEPRWNVLLQEVILTEDDTVEQGAVIEQKLNAAEVVHCARIFKKLAARGATD